MDNNIPNNNFENFEPQKPFTERNPDTNSEQAYSRQPSFDPQKSQHFEQQPVQPDTAEHTAADNYRQPDNYNDGFHQPQYNGYSDFANNFPPQNSQYPQPPKPNGFDGYSFAGGQRPAGNYGTPAYNHYTQGYPSYPPYSVPASELKKTSKGLIAIIIVLSALLIMSLTGLTVYIAANGNSDSNQTNNQGDYSFQFPDSTDPQNDQDDENPNVHSKSDYSDKIKPDYSGLKLEKKPKDASDNKDYNASTASEKISDSVVGIVCYANKVTDVEHCSSQGSGIIISSDGYVITNSHVIANSKTAYIINVVTSDGKTYNAGIVGFDSRTDIAVLKMDDAKNLKPAVFGDSDDAKIGEDIIVVGNPGGLDYQNTTTKGVISAANREISSSSLVKYIQTDAAINPGNSGGPLVNFYGQVIGIATSKIASATYEGMGFAIPSTTARDIVDSLMKKGYVEGRVKIGIVGTAINERGAANHNVPQGIFIREITEGGPCYDTDLRISDVLTEVDDTRVYSFADVYNVLEKHKPGDKITIKYYHYGDQHEYESEITLQEDK